MPYCGQTAQNSTSLGKRSAQRVGNNRLSTQTCNAGWPILAFAGVCYRNHVFCGTILRFYGWISQDDGCDELIPTFPLSTSFVVITITRVFSCHTMCQKSPMVLGRQPCVAIYCFGGPLGNVSSSGWK